MECRACGSLKWFLNVETVLKMNGDQLSQLLHVICPLNLNPRRRIQVGPRVLEISTMLVIWFSVSCFSGHLWQGQVYVNLQGAWRNSIVPTSVVSQLSKGTGEKAGMRQTEAKGICKAHGVKIISAYDMSIS